MLDIGPDEIFTDESVSRRTRDAARLTTRAGAAGDVSPDVLLATAPLEVEGTFSDHVVTPSLPDLRALALANRPDVRLARNNLRAFTWASRLAQSQRTRDVIVGLEYQRVGYDQAVGMTMQIPLFAHNDQRAGILQAAALEHGAETQVRQAERQALTEDVEKAYQAYLAARRALALYSDTNLKQVEDIRSITAYTYQRGGIALVELLDAERTTRQTLIAYNRARAAYQLALFQLEEAVGAPVP